MFIRNLDKSPFANYITQIGDRLYYVTSLSETDINNQVITKPLTDFMKLHISAGEQFFVYDKGKTKKTGYCLKNIVMFINENCKGDSYIIDIPGRRTSLNALYVVFSDEQDRVSFKINFNGFKTKFVIDQFK